MKAIYNSPKADIIKLDLDEEILDVTTGTMSGDGEPIGEEEEPS